jgi:hypothetical protein
MALSSLYQQFRYFLEWKIYDYIFIYIFYFLCISYCNEKKRKKKRKTAKMPEGGKCNFKLYNFLSCNIYLLFLLKSLLNPMKWKLQVASIIIIIINVSYIEYNVWVEDIKNISLTLLQDLCERSSFARDISCQKRFVLQYKSNIHSWRRKK